MTFIVSGKLTVDASQGKSELAQVKAAKDKVTSSTTAMGAADAKAAVEVRKLAAQAEAAAAKNNLLSRAETRAANEAVTLGRSHQLAAGQVGNLTAQFNDIGVMMAAGQNPFQLAIQQGTQITQVIGPMGAAGAAKALKSALVAMVSPMTLITIGSIAVGAAMVNWLTGAAEDAETLEDQLEAVGQAIDSFSEKAAKGRLSTAEMIEEFGKASPELRLILADMAALAKLDAQDAIDSTAESVRNLVLDAKNSFSIMSDSQKFLRLGSVGRANRVAGATFGRNLELLNSSADAATRLKAALDVRAQLLDTVGGLENLNTTQREFYDGLAAIIRDLEVFAGAMQKPWLELKATGADLWSSLTNSAEAYFAKRLQIETQTRGQIDQLRLEEEVQLAILQHGEGSVEVAELRLRAEREAFEQQVESRDVSQDLKAELIEAWDAANGVASVDMAGNISLAADEAHRLTVNLMKAQGQELLGRVRANPDFSDPRGESQGAGNADYVYQDQGLPSVDMPSNPRTKRKTKGGGSAYDKERKALERLMQREREQIDLLREMDPVQQELLRIRDQLKGATDAEREAVEALIRERLEEEKAVAQTREATSFLEGVAGSAADALTKSGDEAAEAWKRVAAELAAAALQAMILGEGPLADLLGGGGGSGGGGGGGFGNFIMGVLGLAEGGTVYGPGGNKDDKVPTFLSPGETVVHAKATRKYRPLLQAMNDGVEIPGLASGGEIGGGSGTGAASGSGSGSATSHAVVRILPSPLFQTMVEETSGNIVVQGIEQYDQTRAPETARRALNDPYGAG